MATAQEVSDLTSRAPYRGLQQAETEYYIRQTKLIERPRVADFLVTYDFRVGATDQWDKFVERAEAEGLLYVFQGTSRLFRLTDTTLWGVFSNSEEVLAAFDRALSAAEADLGRQIVLEKRFIGAISTWSIRSDRKKSPDPRWTGSTKFETCRAHQKHDPFFAY